jgi:kynurenine formamidase
VLVKTGWGRKWSNPNEFLGIKSDGTLSFPGIGLSASKFLVNERGIWGLGIDVVSLDIGQTTVSTFHDILVANFYFYFGQTFPTHGFCGSKNVYLIGKLHDMRQ